jgi:hypothetical protein
MLPFKVGAVVVCDDIRQEQNNKVILIGVYNGILVVPAFPAELILTWWIQLASEKPGEFKLDVRLVKEDGAVALRGMIGFSIAAIDWSAMVLPKSVVQFQSPGKFKLQMTVQGEEDWQTLQELELKQAPTV